MRGALIVLSLLWLAGCASRPPSVGTASVVSTTMVKSTTSWDGAALPTYPEGTPEVTILRIIIPPGMRLPMHYHPVINAGVLVGGELTVVKDDGQRKHLKAGEALIEVVNTLHYGMNEGSEPAEIIVFYAGTEGGAITKMAENKGEP